MIPAAITATSVTSASPIINADAVEAVRWGFRRALSRASEPAAPPNLLAGQPSAQASGRTNRTAQERDTDEDQQRPDAHEEEDLLRTEAVAEQAVDQQGEPGQRSAAPSRPAGTCANRPGGSSAPSRTAAIGGTRVARKAGRRLARTVTRIPTSERDDHRPRVQDETVVRQREADGVEQLEEADAEPEADGDPDDRGEGADGESLDDDREPHLASRRAERPQGRELARPLR